MDDEQLDGHKLEALAARAYAAYWERVTPKHLKMTLFELHSEAYKEDWRRVVRAILARGHA